MVCSVKSKGSKQGGGGAAKAGNYCLLALHHRLLCIVLFAAGLQGQTNCFRSQQSCRDCQKWSDWSLAIRKESLVILFVEWHSAIVTPSLTDDLESPIRRDRTCAKAWLATIYTITHSYEATSQNKWTNGNLDHRQIYPALQSEKAVTASLKRKHCCMLALNGCTTFPNMRQKKRMMD